MSKTVTSAGILGKVYNSRALITDNFDNKTLVKMKDGSLWAVLKENKEDESINLYYSNNQGFEWYWVWSGDLSNENLRESFVNSNTQGPHLALEVFEDQNLLLIWHGYLDAVTLRYNVEPFLFDISNPLSVVRATGETFPDEILIDADYAIDGVSNDRSAYLIYISLAKLYVKSYPPSNILAPTTASSTSTTYYYNLFSTVSGDQGYVDIVVLQSIGTTVQFVFLRYVETYGFTAPSVVYALPTFAPISDLSIARDGYGSLLVVWGQENSSGSDMGVYYSISTDNGVNWTAPSEVERTVGHSAYRDLILDAFKSRTTAMGGVSGFIFSYVRDNESNIPKTYVRTLTTDDDGVTYDLQEEKQVGTSITNASDAVVGLRFFRPSGSSLMSISDPGKISVCLQIGEGNSSVQNDVNPVRIGQEYLSSSAYPLNEQTDFYETDTPDENNLLVSVNVLGGPSSNIDYYVEGLVGSFTYKYTAAFQKAGTNVTFYKYEPLASSSMNDETAYAFPGKSNAKVIFEVSSYGFPLGNSSSENFQEYIERDIRQIHIPPHFHLARNFLVNKGNFFKRTIWTLLFDGNEYEVSQVVPVFIENQIAYYTANLYVIGPSNNPFSKRTLPSET